MTDVDIDLDVLIDKPMDAYSAKAGEYLTSHQLPVIRVRFEPPVNEARTGELDEQMRCDLRLDKATVIEQMPEREQDICRELVRYSPLRRPGFRNSSPIYIYHNIKEIRAFLTKAGIKKGKNDETKSARLQM